MESIKSILTNVLKMSVPEFVFDGRDQAAQAGEVCIRSTLLEAIFGAGEFAILKARRHPDVERDVFSYRLECTLSQGVEYQGKRLKALGAGSSLKDGKIWLGTERAISRIHQYFSSAQEALTYFGIFTSSCHHGIHELEYFMHVVPNGEAGTEDGMGFIPEDLVRQLIGKCRQVQVRMVGRNWLAKGTLLPYAGNAFILPDSMLKGKGSPVNGTNRFYLGIRDVAQTRDYGSNFTLLEWFSEPTIDKLLPATREATRRLKDVFTSRWAALNFLGTDAGNTEDRSVVEKYIKAGVDPTHRWINARLKEMVRKRVVSLALGGALDIKGAMAAYADLPLNYVCAPDIPEGPCVVSRYPIRDKMSFLPAINEHGLVKDPGPGSIYINTENISQLDGDYDGDYLTVIRDDAIIDEVWEERWTTDYKRLDEGPKTRRMDPLAMLPFVAVEAMGNRVGYITYLITSALLNNREELIPELSRSLQLEVQGIKWNTRADQQLLARVSDELEIPGIFREINFDKDMFISRLPKVDPRFASHPLFKVLETVKEEWAGINDLPLDLPHFKYQVPIRDLPEGVITETRSVVGLYNSWISELIEKAEDEPDLSAPIEFIRQWGDSKTENTEDWATALWHVVHSSRSAISTGSAAFNSMPEAMLSLIQDRPLKVPVQTEDLHRSNLLSIPCVGGHYDMPGDSYRERSKAFNDAIRKIGRMATVSITQNPLDINGIDFNAASLRLGSLPRDYRERCAILKPGMEFSAYITRCGRAVYLHIIR